MQLSGAEKARFVNRMFGRIAGRYDAGNRILSLGRDQGWRRRAVAALDPAPDDLVLDLGAGTGDLALHLARRASHVVALDFSRPMLALGTRKAARAHLDRKTTPVAGDALTLPFPEASFDGVATAFTVRNLAPMEQGFSEIYRVLKPGGRMVCMEFTRPAKTVFNRLYRPYLNRVLPLLGGWITGDDTAYRYLAGSINDFPSAGELAAVMRQAEFSPVTWQTVNWGTVAIHLAQKRRLEA